MPDWHRRLRPILVEAFRKNHAKARANNRLVLPGAVPAFLSHWAVARSERSLPSLLAGITALYSHPNADPKQRLARFCLVDLTVNDPKVEREYR
jgi:hypothetical protein